MKKKGYIWVLLLLCFGILTACQTQQKQGEISGSGETDSIPMQDPSMPTDNVFHQEMDYQYSWDGFWKYFQRTPDGLYFWGLGRLYFLGEATLMPQVCCLRPDCEHHFADDACTADMVHGIGYMDGRFYYDESRVEGDKYQGRFCSMDYTGDNRKKLRNYPESVYWIVHRGYLYSYYLEYEENEHSEEGKIVLTQTSLKNPDMTKTVWIGGKSSVHPEEVTAYGNYLIFSRRQYSSEAYWIDLYSLNLQTGELKQFSSKEGMYLKSFRLVGDRILVCAERYRKTECFFSLTLTLEDFREYPEWEHGDMGETSTYLGADGQYIYKGIYDFEKDQHGNLEIMDRDGRLVDAVDLSVLNGKRRYLALYCDPKEDGYVFMTDGSINWGFYYFKKTEIGSGQIELKPLQPVSGTYDYVPPEDFDPETWEELYA